MSDYTQVTDYSAKDALTTGDPDKKIAGADIDAELSAIATAIASKVDEPSAPATNDVLTYSGAWAARAKLTYGSKWTSTSGTSNTWGSIPNWVKRITMLFSGVSIDGTDTLLIQIGDAGGIETTGYDSVGTTLAAASQAATGATTCFVISAPGAAGTLSGSVILTLMDAATYLWVAQGALANNGGGTAYLHTVAGSKALTDVLTQIKLSSTGTFDAGAVNIVYE